MESLKEEKSLNVDTGTVTTDKTSTMPPSHLEAEIGSALPLQPTCKCPDPPDCGNLAQGPPLHCKENFTTSEKESCDELNAVNDNEHLPMPVRRRPLTSIWMPYVAVLLPTLVLPAALIGLVFGYE